MDSNTIPVPDGVTGLQALRALIRERHPLAALQVFHSALGDVFRINLPGFSPVVLVGPEAARFVLVQERENFLWRNETDPVTDLLRHGVLVEDGEEHDQLRHIMNPALHRRMLAEYVSEMHRCVEKISSQWDDGQTVDMLVEMRKIALLVLMQTLYRVDFTPQLKPLWEAILGCIRYISPGVWMIWRGVPRPGYRNAIHQVDTFLYRIIKERRDMMFPEDQPSDMLGLLIQSGLDDGLIRDQLLTMLIAGHDTVTALMAWTMFLLGKHKDVLEQVQRDNASILDLDLPIGVDSLNRLEYLGDVIKESLRLYPPIHLGARITARELEFKGFHIPEGIRVIYSIYLTQRDPAHWSEPDRFNPGRYQGSEKAQPYDWLAFGGGPRNCIGAAFGQLEAKMVIAYLLAHFDFELVERHVTPYMGATLEPHPGVRMRIWRKPAFRSSLG
jgi:cytochrome P450